MPWARYVRTHIFTPAGMTESSFIEDEPHIADMATGYKVADARTVPAQRLFPGWAYAAGGIVSTASDIAKWDLAFFSGRIVPMADVKTITTANPLKDKSGGYGFGWSIDRHDGVRRFWHNGGTFGYLAINEVYPTLSQAFVVLQNSTWLAPDRIGDVVFNELHPELAAAAAKPEPGQDPVITARIKKIWRQFFRGHLDRYEFDAHANAVQTPAAVAEESSLMKALGEPQRWAYAHSEKIGQLTVYDYHVLFTNGILMTATMALSSSGKVSMFLLH
jgi:CubicO group peptidase (beta-lactamase class C family)